MAEKWSNFPVQTHFHSALICSHTLRLSQGLQFLSINCADWCAVHKELVRSGICCLTFSTRLTKKKKSIKIKKQVYNKKKDASHPSSVDAAGLWRPRLFWRSTSLSVTSYPKINHMEGLTQNWFCNHSLCSLSYAQKGTQARITVKRLTTKIILIRTF